MKTEKTLGLIAWIPLQIVAFRIHCGVWYAVYLVLAIGIIVYEASDWGIRGDYPVTALGIAIGLYPIIVLLELMAVVAIARVISRLEKKD